MPRARQKKLETKKIDVSTPRETLGSCASLSEFPRVRLHQNCFSSFLLAQRKGGTARSQVQLIHALLPLDVLTTPLPPTYLLTPQVSQLKRKLMTLLIVYWKGLVPFKAVSKSWCQHFLLFYVQS